MSECVLDASALIVFLKDEPGAEIVSSALASGTWISAVNWSEMLTKFVDLGVSGDQITDELLERGVLGVLLQIVPFDEDAAAAAADLRPRTRALGLSLGDRACLALAQRLDLPALTADRAWQTLDVGIQVRLARPQG